MISFSVLGPLLVHRDGQPLTTRSRTLQRLLALHLAHNGSPVHVDAIVDALWGERPSASVRSTVHVYIHRLRRFLGDEERVEHSLSGYRLIIHPGEFDADVFGDALANAAAARRNGDLETAARLLDDGLGIWRGPAYAGFHDLPQLSAERDRLADRRLDAIEQRAGIDLDTGRHAQVIEVLADPVAEHPYRERLRAQLMLALYRNGRQAEALELYRATRELLVADLGVEPAVELQELHQQMLRSDAALHWPGEETARRFLPRQLPGFVGRSAELATLDRYAADQGVAMLISAIDGTAGVGKTALAVRWGHHAKGRYPDGQLYLDLQGHGRGQAMRPVDALGRLLRMLKVPGEQIPPDLDAAAALFRAEVAGRRILVLLDNAASADQIRPLLPGDSACGVLITSRNRLSGLIAVDGVQRLMLGLLTEDESVDLLSEIIGADRVSAEPAAVRELTRLCGQLPLALRISAAHLADHPSRSIEEHVQELATSDVLGALSIDGDEGNAVRAAFQQSYRVLGPASRNLFALLGVLPVRDFTVEVAAALLDVDHDDASSVLHALISASLVEEPTAGRYQLHDLLRLFAGQLAAEVAEPERVAAAFRAVRWYTASNWSAYEQLSSGARLSRVEPRWREGGVAFADAVAAVEWTAAELNNLAAIVAGCVGDTMLPTEAATQIAHALVNFFLMRYDWATWVAINSIAVEVAHTTGNTMSEAMAHADLGAAYGHIGQFQLSEQSLHRAADLYREAGDKRGLATVIGNIGAVYMDSGRYAEALPYNLESLALNQESGNSSGEAVALMNIGIIHEALGEDATAIDYHLLSLELHRDSDNRHGMASVLVKLGLASTKLGKYDAAASWLDESLMISREMGDRVNEAEATDCLAMLDAREGRLGQAMRRHEEAIAVFEELDQQYCLADALLHHGQTLAAAGRADRAIECWHRARSIFAKLGNERSADILTALIDGHPA